MFLSRHALRWHLQLSAEPTLEPKFRWRCRNQNSRNELSARWGIIGKVLRALRRRCCDGNCIFVGIYAPSGASICRAASEEMALGDWLFHCVSSSRSGLVNCSVALAVRKFARVLGSLRSELPNQTDPRKSRPSSPLGWHGWREFRGSCYVAEFPDHSASLPCPERPLMKTLMLMPMPDARQSQPFAATASLHSRATG